MLTNFTTVWCFYNNFYIIIIYLLLSNLHFIFLSSARTAPEPGHSRLIAPGHNRIKLSLDTQAAVFAGASREVLLVFGKSGTTNFWGGYATDYSNSTYLDLYATLNRLQPHTRGFGRPHFEWFRTLIVVSNVAPPPGMWTFYHSACNMISY